MVSIWDWMSEAGDTSSEFSKYELTEPIHNLNKSVNNGLFSLIRERGLFRPFGEAVRKGLADGTIDGSIVEEVGRSAWEETIKAADEAYAPGTFTTFAAYEYTSSFDLYDKYLHRNVIFRDNRTSS